MRESWIRWMVSGGEERSNETVKNEVVLMTRKFLLKTAWVSWFAYHKSELGGREALK